MFMGEYSNFGKHVIHNYRTVLAHPIRQSRQLPRVVTFGTKCQEAEIKYFKDYASQN